MMVLDRPHGTAMSITFYGQKKSFDRSNSFVNLSQHLWCVCVHMPCRAEPCTLSMVHGTPHIDFQALGVGHYVSHVMKIGRERMRGIRGKTKQNKTNKKQKTKTKVKCICLLIIIYEDFTTTSTDWSFCLTASSTAFLNLRFFTSSLSFSILLFSSSITLDSSSSSFSSSSNSFFSS